MNWKKIIRRTLAVLAIMFVIAIVGGYFYLKSSTFNRFAMRKIIEQANQATGGHTQIGAFDFEPSTLTVHLYGVVLRGTEPPAAYPLLEVNKLTVGLKIQSVLHHKINLSELLIEHPVVYLQVDRKGNSNVPQAPPSKSGSNMSVFDLAVGHVALTDGEVNYNDRKTLVDADLHNLRSDIVFEPWATRYSGSVSYDNGHLRYGQYTPLAHSFNVKFNATPSVFSLESAVLKVASSTVALHADVTNYSDPNVSGNYDIQIHTQDLAAISRSPSVRTAGDVLLTGKLRYRSKNNQPLLRSVAIDGQIGSEALSAVFSGRHFDLRKLRGKYQLANGSLRASGVARRPD